MRYITIDAIKTQARLECCAEDGLLELYGDSAEDMVLNMLNRTYENLLESYDMVPAPIVHATLILAAHAYNHRDDPAGPIKLYDVPYSVDALLKPYMIL